MTMNSVTTAIEVRPTDRPTAAVIQISGDITSASEAALMEAYGRAAGAGARTFVLDFGGLDYMNSGGIGLLVTLLVRVQRQGQRLLAVGLNEHYRQILALTRLDEAIGIHDTESAALNAPG
jgi:anti-sigma B factor antagonist